MPVRFDDKLSFLSAPESYPGHMTQVTVLQTHHAWLFMTDRHVFKMKKPFRLGGRDYSSVEARHELCLEEVRLNRRLARQSYLGVVPLVRNAANRLELDGEGNVIEWLVKMLRLPETRTLPTLAAEGRVTAADIRALMRKLARFHEGAPVCHYDAGAYEQALRRRLDFWTTELGRARFTLPEGLLHGVTAAQHRYLDAYGELLEQRQRDGCIRDVHGDLRPEHVFLLEDAEPAIIDSLEFDAELRRLDCLAELAYFAMECRHAGLERLGRDCIAAYREEQSAAAGPGHLLAFYQTLAATTRAGLAAWRIAGATGDTGWSRRVVDYLYDAEHYVSEALPRLP